MRFGLYYRCHQEIIRITLLYVGGNQSTCTINQALNFDIPHNRYPYIAQVDEESEIKYLAQRHKHVGTNMLKLTTVACLLVMLCSARPHTHSG